MIRPRLLSLSVFLSLFTVVCASARAQDSQTLVVQGAAPASTPALAASTDASVDGVTIPGPLRSFLRMAGISQKVSPEEVLPLLARNVSLRGYAQSSRDKARKPNEYLLLIRSYLNEARDLRAMAGPEQQIRVANCNAAGPLLQVIGYRMREPCGPTTSLETSDPDRAFLTIDSGFPLVDLEEALRANKPFVYAYPSTRVPVLFKASDWIVDAKTARPSDFLDVLLAELPLAHLYSALGKMDLQVAEDLKKSQGLPNLLRLAPVLDFYGGHLAIRAGKVSVPGGEPAEQAWETLVGAKTNSPGEFMRRLLTKDDGWLAAYFDAIGSGNPAQQAYFADAQHLTPCYSAFRAAGTSFSPAQPAFRPDTYTVLLVTRMSLDPDGRPHVPGGLAAWHDILGDRNKLKAARDLIKHVGAADTPDQFLQQMFALSRISDRSGPVALYLALNEIDRGRPADRKLSPVAVKALAERFARLGEQYAIFSEFAGLGDDSITEYLTVATSLDQISNPTLRGNAMGLFQSTAGLWQILARQGEIPAASMDASWKRTLSPFAKISSSAELFDASQDSIESLFGSVGGGRAVTQAVVVEELAGPPSASAEEEAVRREFQARINGVLADQRLVSLDTLLDLGHGLSQLGHDQSSVNSNHLADLVSEIREFEMPKAIFSESEKAEWSSGKIDNAHIALQARTDLLKVIKSHSSPEAVAEARGELAPFLRDTLVGFNYAYYEPPGDQILHNNPLFVRSHDFGGGMSYGGGQSWQVPSLFGLGETAGGGGHLAGSLADLPYVLATADQDFVVPENVQELVWEEMVPSLLTTATLSRWWGVSPAEMHAAALYQKTGEELIATSAKDETVRKEVLDILAVVAEPRTTGEIDALLRNDQADDVIRELTPAETAFVAAEFRRRLPGVTNDWGSAGNELERQGICCAADMNWDRITHDFGVPHPVLARSFARELLSIQPIPAFMGYPSRLLAESWESTNLYWARLADEMGYTPAALNRLAPQLTFKMTQKIAATDVEDWPAILRAMRETGDEFRRSNGAEKQKTAALSTPGPGSAEPAKGQN